MWNIAVVLLLFMPILSAAAGEAPSAGPQATALQVRAARGELRMPGRKIIFNVSEDGGIAGEKLTLTLAHDLVVVSRGSTDKLYDFALRRILTIDRTSRSFANTSLYGNLAGRVFEAQNRAFISGALNAAKVETQPQQLDAFWAASELGVVLPNQALPTIERRAEQNNSIVFSYGGQEVARVTPSSVQLSAEELRRLGSFLHYECALHPEIVSALLATGRLPQKFAFERAMGLKRTRVTYELASVEAIEVTYPLPGDYRADPLPARSGDTASEEFRTLLPIVLEAIALRHGGGPRSVSDYEMAIDHALSSGKGFQALLLAVELSLQHGNSTANCATTPVPQPCHSLGEIRTVIGNDERAESYIAAMQAEQVGRDVGKAMMIWRAIPRDDLVNGYVIDDHIANAMTAKGMLGGETLSMFASAIRGNPYAPTFYKDLGDYFARQYRTDLAWLCYDLGRDLPDANATPVLPSITNLEKRLATDFPQFF
jgi:hypothetical protein